MKIIEKIGSFACIAVIAASAIPAKAETMALPVSERTPGFADVNKSKVVKTGWVYAGRFFKWIGDEPYYCDKNAPKNCVYKVTKMKTVSRSWKVGTEFTAKETFEMGEISGKYSEEWSDTISKSFSDWKETTIRPGRTAVPALFIHRDLVSYKVTGVWKLTSVNQDCRHGVKCDIYRWLSGDTAGTFRALVSKDTRMTFMYVSYDGSRAPAWLKVE